MHVYTIVSSVVYFKIKTYFSQNVLCCVVIVYRSYLEWNKKVVDEWL